MKKEGISYQLKPNNYKQIKIGIETNTKEDNYSTEKQNSRKALQKRKL